MSEEKQFHFYAATSTVWAVAHTRAEAIAKIAAQYSTEEIKGHIKEFGGLFVATYRVDVPIETHYRILMYIPTGVPVTKEIFYRIVNRKGHVIPSDIEA